MGPTVLDRARLRLQRVELHTEKGIGFGQALGRADVQEGPPAHAPVEAAAGERGEALSLQAHGAPRRDGVDRPPLDQVDAAAEMAVSVLPLLEKAQDPAPRVELDAAVARGVGVALEPDGGLGRTLPMQASHPRRLEAAVAVTVEDQQRTGAGQRGRQSKRSAGAQRLWLLRVDEVDAETAAVAQRSRDRVPAVAGGEHDPAQALS